MLIPVAPGDDVDVVRIPPPLKLCEEDERAGRSDVERMGRWLENEVCGLECPWNDMAAVDPRFTAVARFRLDGPCSGCFRSSLFV